MITSIVAHLVASGILLYLGTGYGFRLGFKKGFSVARNIFALYGEKEDT